MVKSIFFMCFLVLIYSCTSNLVKERANSEVTDVYVDVDDVIDELDFSLFLNDEAKFIKLETTDSCLISEMKQISYVDGKIYIADELSQSVYIFNDSGSFLKKIGVKGQGPGEYVRLGKFQVVGNYLYIKDDASPWKLYVYDLKSSLRRIKDIEENLSNDELMQKKREYEQIYTQISPFANMQMNFTVSDSKSEANGTSDGKTSNLSYTTTKGTSLSETDSDTHTVGTSETIGDTLSTTHTDNESVSDGNTHTSGSSDGVSTTITNGINVSKYKGKSSSSGFGLKGFSRNKGKNKGTSIGYNHSVSKGTSHTDSVSDSISKTLTHGFSDSNARSESKTIGENQSDSQARSLGVSVNQSDAYTAGEAFNLVNSQTLTDTFGNSKGITLNAENMTLNLVMQRLKKHLERIEECESFGMWNFAAYFLGETAAETETAANTYKSVVAGTDRGIECNAINSWNDDQSIAELKPYLYHFMHPEFVYSGFSYDNERYIAVNPSALESTNELAIHMGIPRHSVKGLPVVEHAAFGQEVIS